jgi:hypothetical protein
VSKCYFLPNVFLFLGGIALMKRGGKSKLERVYPQLPQEYKYEGCLK